MVQAVITRMLATEDYFFFAINPDQAVTAFRSRLESGDLAGLRANQERFKDAHCPSTEYERAVVAFAKKPDPPGQVMEWVCRQSRCNMGLKQDSPYASSLFFRGR